MDGQSIGPSQLADIRAGGGHDRLPFTGQSAGLVHDIAPAAEIMARLIEETETALRSAQAMASG